MNFRPRAKDEPEINLIPFIDVLLVILIFLMLTTTYSKFTELQLTLPVADADQQRDHPKEVIVAVAADGRYAVNKAGVEGKSVDAVARALREAASAVGKDSVVIISADANSPHQSVVTVMEAARRVGLTQITFATQSSAGAARAGASR
jgi:biopolymer transport protein ExbD